MTFADALNLRIKDRIHLLNEAIMKGSVKDFNEYKYIVGQLESLRWTLNEIEIVTQDIEND